MLTLAIPMLAFMLIFFLSSRMENFWQGMRSKGRVGWGIDALSLLMQGWVFPLAQAYLLLPLFRAIAAPWEGRLELPYILGFALSFVLVDYAYYWNHRLLHTQKLWPWHRTHHSSQAMDIFVSSRNGLITHFFIIYIWVNSLCLFLLKDDTGYLLGIALTSALDLWRHSPLRLTGFWNKILGSLLILPRDHAWHHARYSQGENFGANLALWDRLHGTWRAAPADDFPVGEEGKLSWKHAILPVKEGEL